MAEVRVAETMAIVVPIYDAYSLDFPEGYIPAEPKFCEGESGYQVYVWEDGCYVPSDAGPFDELEEVMKVAQAMHLEICEKEGISP